jgi:hypothetical protein
MEFLVRVQDVFQFLAFVSNDLRLPRPRVSPGNASNGSIAMRQIDSSEHPFYRIRVVTQTPGGVGFPRRLRVTTTEQPNVMELLPH